MSTRPQSARAEDCAAPALDRLLAMPTVVHLTSLSRFTRKVADGSFPPRSRLGSRASPGEKGTSLIGSLGSLEPHRKSARCERAPPNFNSNLRCLNVSRRPPELKAKR